MLHRLEETLKDFPTVLKRTYGGQIRVVNMKSGENGSGLCNHESILGPIPTVLHYWHFSIYRLSIDSSTRRGGSAQCSVRTLYDKEWMAFHSSKNMERGHWVDFSTVHQSFWIFHQIQYSYLPESWESRGEWIHTRVRSKTYVACRP